jgi:prepilin-type processing-associated H-X9-DG protein
MIIKKQRVCTKNNIPAFTLMELLVVMAITCLLIALILPVLGLARKIGRRTICQGNLKQITYSWHMYFEDYDGLFYHNLRADTLYGGWKSLKYPTATRPLNSYLSIPNCPESESEAKVFKCPSDTGDIGTKAFSSFSYRGSSYRTNILLVGQEQVGPLAGEETEELRTLRQEINSRLPHLRFSSIGHPERLLFVGDSPWAVQWLFPPYGEGPSWHEHHIHYNLSFLDGHVKFLQINKGRLINSGYTVIPFEELYELARDAQLRSK